MRLVTYDRYGPADVLSVTTAPVPRPRPGEVLVRVLAVSVNGGELAMRAGRLLPFSGKRFPKRVGIDLAGEVAEAGNSRFAVGDLVWGQVGRRPRSAAEYVAVRPELLDHVPAGLDAVQAVSLPVGTTAITALRDLAALAPGERLLVRGATGGVGYVGVQLGKAMGAHVTGLASAGNLDLVKELGADEAIDYRAPGDLGRFDVILDTVGTRAARVPPAAHPSRADGDDRVRPRPPRPLTGLHRRPRDAPPPLGPFLQRQPGRLTVRRAGPLGHRRRDPPAGRPGVPAGRRRRRAPGAGTGRCAGEIVVQLG
jgi:D-arabinose 1-dehydrogenase-like Zn-dependent alcohol dehydrogenase